MSVKVLSRFRNLPLFRGLNLGSLWWGWVLAVASTVAFSLATPLGKTALNLGLNPTTLLVLRFGLGIMLLVISIGLTSPGKLRVDRYGFLVAGMAGFVNGFGVLAFFWSLTRLDASVATMIFSLNPLAILGVLALRGEKLTYRHLIRLGLGLGGVYLLIGPSGQVDWVGAALIGVSISCIAFELATIQWFLQAYDSRTVTLYVLAGMMTTITGFWLWQGAEWHQPGWRAWLVVGLLGGVCTYFAWWAMFQAIRHIGSGQVALLTPLETMLTVLWSFLFLQERFTFWQMAGSVCILLSALLAIQRLRRVRWRPRWRAWLRL